MAKRTSKGSQTAQAQAPQAPVAPDQTISKANEQAQTEQARKQATAEAGQAEARLEHGKAVTLFMAGYTDTPENRVEYRNLLFKDKSLKTGLLTPTYPGTLDFVFKSDAPKATKPGGSAKVSDEIKAQMTNLLSRVKYLVYMDSQMPGSSWSVEAGRVSIWHSGDNLYLSVDGTGNSTEVTDLTPELLKAKVKEAYLSPAPKAE